MNNFYGYNLGQLPGRDLPKVKGIESAKMFITMPDSRCAVFDEDDDVFYIIETDSSNFKSKIRRFRFYEETIEEANDAKMSQCCCDIKTQMLQYRLDDANAKIISQQAELSNNRQTQDILNSLGRFVAWAGSGSQAATVNG